MRWNNYITYWVHISEEHGVFVPYDFGKTGRQMSRSNLTDSGDLVGYRIGRLRGYRHGAKDC